MFYKISEGDVYATENSPWRGVGSRIARLPDNRYICVFNANSQSGMNDFCPMASYSDDGENWEEPKPIWPELIGIKSVYVSVRNTGDGRICLAGNGYNIDKPGEVWWDDASASMKENFLTWSISEDGYSFPLPNWVELPYYGAAEIPGGMLIDEDGVMTFVYAPYPTIEQREETDTCCLVLMRSTDEGKSWESSKTGIVVPPSEYAETWIVKLTNGKYMISTWQTASTDTPDQYLFSDDGLTFVGPFALPFNGQSTALEPWKDGSVLVVYNQRKETPVGVWLVWAKPDKDGFHMITNQPVWEASTGTCSDSSGEFSDWLDFSFGEPHVLVLPDDTLLVCLWYEKDGISGVRYVHLEYKD